MRRCGFPTNQKHLSEPISAQGGYDKYQCCTVKPPIIATSETSIPLLIPVFVEPPCLTYGKSLPKFQTSHSFRFQVIQPILIPENAYPRKICKKIGLKKKNARKRRKEEERKTNNPRLHEG